MEENSLCHYSKIKLIRPDTDYANQVVELEAGVGRFVLLLERLGFKSIFSCEGHFEKESRLDFYIVFGRKHGIEKLNFYTRKDLRVVQGLSVLVFNLLQVNLFNDYFNLTLNKHVSCSKNYDQESVDLILNNALRLIYTAIGEGEDDYLTYVDSPVPVSQIARDRLIEKGKAIIKCIKNSRRERI